MTEVSNPRRPRFALTSDAWIAAGLFVAVLLTHLVSRNITPFDSRWVVYSALSLLHEGNLNLDEYKPLLDRNEFYATECVGGSKGYAYLPYVPADTRKACDGNYYHYYPLAVPVLTSPILWTVEGVLTVARPALVALERADPNFNRFRHAMATGDLAEYAVLTELGAACVFIALAAVFVYFLCRQDLPPLWSVALTLVFAFATSAWSTGSRALWQHTLSMPLLAASLWLLSAARRRPWLAACAGLPLMAAYWVRPTNIVSLVLFSIYVLVFYRRHFALFLAAMLPPLLLFAAMTFSVYGTLQAPYANAGRAALQLQLHQEFWLALAGNLWSPARGLFVYMPFVLLIPFFPPLASLGKPRVWLHRAALAVFLLHTLLLSSFIAWWGGHCFGPRYLSDLCPLLTFLAIPLIAKVASGHHRIAPVLLLLVAVGVFIHWRGANSQDVQDWNTQPVEIGQAQWRIWDWSDLPFLRGLKR